MFELSPGRNVSLAILFFGFFVFSLNGCNDTSSVTSTGPAGPAQLAILTPSPLPDGTQNQAYNFQLAATGGTGGYTWSLAAGSPPLPTGLTLSAGGKISGTPTSLGTATLKIAVQDSATSPQTAQATLSLTINIAPIPLQIVTNSLPSGTINVAYFKALVGNGGTTPYTWGLKTGSPLLPPGLTLDTANGFIQGTPTQTGTTTPIFTLKDAALTTVETALTLTIGANPLSITTNSLPQGTQNQNYSATLVATGGTGSYTWGLAGGSPPLPSGLTLNPSTGAITGIPTTTSSLNYTFMVTDQTPPTPQTVSKTLQLLIGASAPPLTITSPAGNSLPSGSVGAAYSTTLTASGGTGAQTWSIISGGLPNGLSLTPSTGAITGTPQLGSNGNYVLTIKVQDSGNPQQSVQKPNVSLTINLPAPPSITTPSLPAGTFGVAYNQTVAVSGGFGTLVWGITTGALPPGLTLNPSSGNISGNPTSTGSFNFTLRVTDQTSQFDQKSFTILINPPAPPSITSPNSASLPTGTVNQPYTNTQLQAINGSQPYTWSVSPALPNGLSLDPNSGVISGTPLSGSNGNYNPTFTVTDSTFPTHLTGTRSYSLTINANVTPVTITTSSLPNGTVGQSYSGQLAASGGTQSYTFSVNSGSSLPAGLSLSASGAITGTPTATNSSATTFRVQDSTVPNQQSATRSLTITINAAPPPLVITTTSPLPAGTENQSYSTTLAATGGTPPYSNWGVTPALPSGLSLNSSTGAITGTPGAGTAGTASYTFSVQDSTSGSVTKPLSLTIHPALTPLTITTPSPLPSGKVGSPYGAVGGIPATAVTLAATGGTPPYTWSTTVTPPLPAGLGIDAAGNITGTPTASETSVSHTFAVTDSAVPTPATVNKALSLTIAP